MNVLVVDDSVLTAYLLKDYLEQHGCGATQTGDAKHAMELLALNQFDAVVLDYCLPNGDGLTVLKAIRGDTKITKGKTIPVIFVTGLDLATTSGTALALLKHPPVAILMKPVPPEKILSEIQRLTMANEDPQP